MLLVRAAMYSLLFIVLIKSTEGSTRSKVITIIADGKRFSNNSNTSNLYKKDCVDCDCSYHSFDQVLSNLTSNVLINIMTDITLSSIIHIDGLTNVSIKGHQSPTVNCDNYGGLSFTSCHKLSIEGITWKGCGISNNDSSHPAVYLYNCTSITITNCSFQYSMGQVVVLFGVSGDVNINYCNFSSNKYYKSNGTAIHYSDPLNINTPLYLIITGCNFYHNEGDKGVVYFGQSAKVHEYLYLQNSNFYHNKGVAIYLYNQTLHMNGNIEFHNNTAEKGGGIFVTDYSKIVFLKGSNVNFVNNTATRFGGAIFITNHSSVLIAENTISSNQQVKALQSNKNLLIMVTFNYNEAKLFGGTIYVNNSDLMFGKNVMVEFNKNKVDWGGGAICTDINSVVTFQENSKVTFINNQAGWAGGAALIYACNFTFKGNSAVVFSNNVAEWNGAAVYIYHFSNVTIEDISLVNFSDNIAQKFCGAMDITNSSGAFEGNSTIVFKKNNGNNAGGAMCIDTSNITLRGNSAIKFNKNIAYFGGAIYINRKCNVTFEESSTISFHHNEAISGGAMFIERFSMVTLEKNNSVTFYDNKGFDGGAIYIANNSSATFKGSVTVVFQTNLAEVAGGLFITLTSNVTFTGNSVVIFYNNAADALAGAFYISDSIATFEENTTVKFNYNHANNGYGGALYAGNSNITFKENSSVMFIGNEADINGGAIVITGLSNYTINKNATLSWQGSFNDTNIYNIVGTVNYGNSSMTFDGNSTITLSNNIANQGGGALYTFNNSVFLFQGHSRILFYNNTCKHNGYGGAYFVANSSVAIMEGNSKITFHNNKADFGGAIYGKYFAVSFKGNSSVTFSDNKGSALSATSGALAIFKVNVTFDDDSTVTFLNNKADDCGGAMLAVESNITFNRNANVNFISNQGKSYGGALCILNTNIIFTGNSITIFENNQGAHEGGAMSVDKNSNITFERSSVVIFNGNKGYIGGALVAYDMDAKFKENSVVILNGNEGFISGALHLVYSNVTIEGNSTVKFISNIAYHSLGGAVYAHYSYFIIQGNSTVKFHDNNAEKCGAMCIYNSTATIRGTTTVEFRYNQANVDGGAMCISNSNITFRGECMVTFTNNSAINGYGGAVYIDRFLTLSTEGNSAEILSLQGKDVKNVGITYIYHPSNVSFQENSIVTFSLNKAYNGGAICSYNKAQVTFHGNSSTMFINNFAIQGGGVLYSYAYCSISFKENSVVTFSHNKASQGGVIYSQLNSHIRFEGFSTVRFVANVALDYGGAINLFINTFIMFTDYADVIFDGNSAKNGGAVYSDSTFSTITKTTYTALNNNETAFTSLSNITIAENSSVTFINNTALKDGGSVYLSHHSSFILIHSSKVGFYHNIASDYGGAIYAQSENSLLKFNISDIHFISNKAGTKNNSLYINVLKSCNINCLGDSTKDIDHKHFLVSTSPSKLVIYRPARCINGTDSKCNAYFINNMMLGQEITLNGCLLDYYDQSTETAQFLVTSIDKELKISSSSYISISCNRSTQGIIVKGDLHNNISYNFSLIISLHVNRISESKIISTNLMIEFSQCHPGFLYSKESQRCECYSSNEIVSCSGSSSTIKRGYWFGCVNRKSTVTTCPNNYCNFTCCKITNGIYHLSPVRTNQCRSHRTGVACGNCKEGYALSFDSTECIEVTQCTAGQTILVTMLTLLYWIFIMIAVFTMTYFKVSIGSLYAIVYYCNVVDILLYQDYFISSRLHTAVNIMSSLAKLTPQFLGQLCLVRNVTGIDQQFIHYIHPVGVMMLAYITKIIAKKSHRVPSFISKGIINFICFILLLSYTSVTTTSLLLLRSLTFMNIDKVYTYSSPDIEYFHGRHLAYVLVAVTFTIVIVIGLPLFLLLEPFLKPKINFIKIKPLLDQFQGCYKDKYRCFATYYMICRVVIILLIIVRVFDEFTTQYMLFISCTLMALIHLIIRPYNKAIQNTFDGVVLQLIVIISILPMVEFLDNYNRVLVVVITYLLIISPIASFITIKFLLHKNQIKNVIKDWFEWCSWKLEYSMISSGDIEPINTATEDNIDDSALATAT